ncbi:GNAT family N-acetyltransferase [Oscillospiraceae bacterium PP1C4]
MFIDFAEQQDIDSWMDLLQMVKDNFPGLDMKEYRIALLDCILNKQALIAKAEDVIVGALTFSKRTGELSFLAVHPLYRKIGIAKALIAKLVSQSPKGKRLSVITYRQGEEQGIAARKLYQSIGFQCGELLTVFDYPCQELYYITK